MSEVQEAKKRSKKRYGGPRNKKFKGSRELEVGMQGILITCNMNERKCTSEAYSLLNEYADKLFGPESFTGAEDSHSEEEEDDAEAAVKKEVSQMKSSTRQRRFMALDSGANNVVFIRTHNIDPEKLVHHILKDLHETKKKKSRAILRMLPVCGTCRAFPDDMEKFMSSFLEPWFQAPRWTSFQISFKARNSSHNNRDDVIKALAGVPLPLSSGDPSPHCTVWFPFNMAVSHSSLPPPPLPPSPLLFSGLVGKMNPKNKVDLTDPELTVIVEVIKTVCCVSVVRDYMLFRKYNLQEVTKGPPNQVQGQQEVVKSEASPTESGRSEGGGEKEGSAETTVVAQGNGSKEVEQE